MPDVIVLKIRSQISLKSFKYQNKAHLVDGGGGRGGGVAVILNPNLDTSIVQENVGACGSRVVEKACHILLLWLYVYLTATFMSFVLQKFARVGLIFYFTPVIFFDL